MASSLALLCGAALAGEGEVRIIAAPGDRATGIGTADLLPGAAVGIDRSGRVLFFAGTDSEGVLGAGWFLGDGSKGSRPKLVILDDAALPGGAGVDVTGLELTFANPVFLSQSGRVGLIGSTNTLAKLDALLTSDAQGGLRTISAVLRALPGVCNYRPRGVTLDITSALIHDDFVFFPGNITNEFGQTSPCSEADAVGPALMQRQGTNDAVLLAHKDVAVPLRPKAEFLYHFAPRGAFADGSLVFTATVNAAVPGFLARTGLFTSKPNVGLFTVAIAGEDAPGTGETIGGVFGSPAFDAVRIVDGARNDFVEVVYAARLFLTEDWAIYSTRENSGSAPLFRTGATDGAYTFAAGQEAPAGIEILPGPIGRLIVIGATTGPDLPFGKGIGVWRYDPIAPKKLTLIAYEGMTFQHAQATLTVESIHSVHVNSTGRVAMEVVSDVALGSGDAILIEEKGATGTFRCALRAGNEVAAREGGESIGDGRVISLVSGTPRFPNVTTSGADGYSARFNDRGEFVANLGGIGSGAIAKGVYVVSLEKPGPVPPAPKAANVKVKARNGAAKIIGSKLGDAFDIALDAAGMATITPKDGTTLNGGSDDVTVDASKSLTIKTKKGDDKVTITGPGAGANAPISKVTVDIGPGDSDVNITDTAAGRLTVKGSGVLDVFLENVRAQIATLGNKRADDVCVEANGLTVDDGLQVDAPGARLTAKSKEGGAFDGDAAVEGKRNEGTSTVEVTDATAKDVSVKTQGDTTVKVNDAEMDKLTLQSRGRRGRGLTTAEYQIAMAKIGEEFRANFARETAELRIRQTRINNKMLIDVGKAANEVVVEFVNAVFGTGLIGSLCGNARIPNIQLTVANLRDDLDNGLEFVSVVKNIKGVIVPAKR